jgi:hypothetical protein
MAGICNSAAAPVTWNPIGCGSKLDADSHLSDHAKRHPHPGDRIDSKFLIFVGSISSIIIPRCSVARAFCWCKKYSICRRPYESQQIAPLLDHIVGAGEPRYILGSPADTPQTIILKATLKNVSDQSVRADLPDEAPKPSIRASVPSRSASRTFTSCNQE